MATEYIQKSYYETTKRKFIDVSISTMTVIENFLSTLLYSKDLSRVVYSDQETCFRKRLEKVSSDQKDFEHIQAINLNLPFASYRQSADFEADDRPSAVNAGQSLVGDYIDEFGSSLRSVAVKSGYKAICFYSRLDDVRLAQQLLFWEMEPKAPIRYYINTKWQGHTLAIPVFITITGINTKPDYAESDWLKQSRIFPIEVEMEVRTYQVLIPSVDKVVNLPIRFSKPSNEGGAGNVYTPKFNYSPDTLDVYNDEEPTMYFAQESILMWAENKFDLDDSISDEALDSAEVKLNAECYWKSNNYTHDQLVDMVGTIPNNVTNDIVKGYWNETFEVALNRLRVAEKTSTSFKIQCIVKPADYKYFDNITFHIPGHESIVMKDPTQTEVIVDGLLPNSIYNIKVVVQSNRGVMNTIILEDRTPDDPTNLAPSPENTFKGDNQMTAGVVAVRAVKKTEETTETQSQETQPIEEKKDEPQLRRIRGNALIGMKY